MHPGRRRPNRCGSRTHESGILGLRAGRFFPPDGDVRLARHAPIPKLKVIPHRRTDMPDSKSLKVESNVAVTMRDGVTLYADIYRPDSDGPFPTILQRRQEIQQQLLRRPKQASSYLLLNHHTNFSQLLLLYIEYGITPY